MADPSSEPSSQPSSPPSSTLDPDARFLLANERTLLAWLRTALALEGAGLAVLQFGTRLDARAGLGAAFLVVGAFAGLAGLLRYRSADRALRAGVLPARGAAPEILALCVVAAAVVVLIAYGASEWSG